jgi:CRP/FNR family transcriptional regulator, cyclic AMP receptor protein
VARLKDSAKLGLLRSVNLFSGCSDKELAEISRLTTEVEVAEGKVVCRQGETGNEFFVIIDGTASVTIDGEEVNVLGAGDFFGELALLDGGERLASVTATSPLDVLVLSRSEFQSLLHAVPSLAVRMLHAIGARLRSAHEVGLRHGDPAATVTL